MIALPVASPRWTGRAVVQLAALALGACGGPSLTIERTEAGGLTEGLGCGPRGCEGACTVDGCPGERRAPLVLVTTSRPVVAASAAIPGVDVAIAVDVLATSADGARTALAVRVPASAALPAGAWPLALTVVDADGGTASTADAAATALVLTGLDELVLTGPLPPAPADGVRRYSTIVVPTAIVAELDGAAPVRLVASGDVVLAGVIAADATAARPGPGGCAGQARATAPLACPDGDGRGSETDDGGGGSYGTRAAGPLAGAITGHPLAVPLGRVAPLAGPPTALDDNRGHGGGAAAERAGGGGGGAILLAAEGRVSLGQFARVTARGAGPAPGGRPSGGGGSGGAIVVHAGAGLDVDDAAPLPFEATGGGDGGLRGGDGRIRLDAPGLSAFERASPAPWFGPAWRAVPLVVPARATVTLDLDARLGEADAPAIVVDGADLPLACAPVAGACQVSLPLAPGPHTLCAVARLAHARGPENQACVVVAVVD